MASLMVKSKLPMICKNADMPVPAYAWKDKENISQASR
jgi:hypothetical protein